MICGSFDAIGRCHLNSDGYLRREVPSTLAIGASHIEISSGKTRMTEANDTLEADGPQYWRLFLHHVACASSADLLLTELLLYNAAVHIERAFGSIKYAVRSSTCIIYLSAK